MSGVESALEQFRRATAATVRAIARREDVNVAFSPSSQGVAGNELRLPLPPRDLPLGEVAPLRGEADAHALRLRHHDSKTHSSEHHSAPGNPSPRLQHGATCDCGTVASSSGLVGILEQHWG
jgi:cobalamin biosynthesis protein CobT